MGIGLKINNFTNKLSMHPNLMNLKQTALEYNRKLSSIRSIDQFTFDMSQSAIRELIHIMTRDNPNIICCLNDLFTGYSYRTTLACNDSGQPSEPVPERESSEINCPSVMKAFQRTLELWSATVLTAAQPENYLPD